MARPLIEFIHSQNIAWRADPRFAGRTEVSVKVLSVDEIDGSSTVLVRFPPGFAARHSHWCGVDEEFFVLKGDFSVNGLHFYAHHYGYWPAGYVREEFCVGDEGAEAIICYSGAPVFSDDFTSLPEFDPSALTEHLSSFDLEWDQTNMDPNISHLNAFRKNLRLAPDGSCRTYLLSGLPQGYPKSGAEPLERHPHVEEMFMIAGDMPCSLGIMRMGAYFWRPPHIWHGADCTVNGFLLFCRTPGSNQTISEWADKPYPVHFQPSHNPKIPGELKSAALPLPDPVEY